MRAVQLSPAEDRSRSALDLVMKLRDVSNSELGRRLGVVHVTIINRRKGGARIRQQDVTDLATALGVPEKLLRMDQGDVLRWFADHPEMLGNTEPPADPGILMVSAVGFAPVYTLPKAA